MWFTFIVSLMTNDVEYFFLAVLVLDILIFIKTHEVILLGKVNPPTLVAFVFIYLFIFVVLSIELSAFTLAMSSAFFNFLF